MKRFVMGDIHGAHKALVQCLERSNFNKEEDLLIQLGDVVDGWEYVYEVVEELLTIKNLIPIVGNHDDWFTQWIRHGIHPVRWTHGGLATAKSYGKLLDDFKFIAKYTDPNDERPSYIVNLNPDDVPPSHQKFFRSQISYYIDDDNNCFVHGGFNRHEHLKGQRPEILMWDRDLWMAALSFNTRDEDYSGLFPYKFKMKDNFNKVFIGHTATTNWSRFSETTSKGGIVTPVTAKDIVTIPMRAANIINMDTGAGFNGKLTIMNVDTEEYFQSDIVSSLYPDEIGRG